MKLQNFLFIIVFNFSLFTTSNQFVKRNLVGNSPKFFLIGFGDYLNNNHEEITFNIYLIKYEAEQYYSDIYFDTSVIYQNSNKNNILPAKCSITEESVDHSLIYKCIVKNGIKNNITSISLNHYSFIVTNSSVQNLTFDENQIILSTLAEKKRKNIANEDSTLNFNIFYLNEEPVIKKNGVELYGNIIWKGNDARDFNFYLNSEKNINCSYYFNYSGDNYDKISFSPKIDVNAHLDNIIEKTNFPSDHYILIISNTTNDLILYSNDKNPYIELYGFKNYKKQTTNDNANAIAHLRGTLYSLSKLKNFMTFTANTDNGKNITALGYKISNETDNNTICYYIDFLNTSKMNEEPNIFYKDFIFSDYLNFSNSIKQIDVYPRDLYIRSEFNIKEIKFPEKPKEISNGLYFDFADTNEFKDYTFKRNADAYMSYNPLNENFTEEIKCTFKNNTDSYNLICHPEKSFITYMNTVRMTVEGIRKSRRLRFLQTKENITFSSPLNSTELIDYTYDPDFNTFAKKVSKDKGLSAGAIVAIVLSCIAVVAVVGVAIFFLNRKPANPVKYVNNNNSYFQNSTSEINKQ
jgi:hypothetical protein